MLFADFTIVNLGTLSLNKYWHETERLRPPSATCTLLNIAGIRLIVDPSPAPAPLETLLFANTGLRPDAIDLVFLTHHHADHRFGLELFKGKRWLMAAPALEEWKRADPADEPLTSQVTAAEGNLPDGIDMFASPGHTLNHYSLAANTRAGRLIVAGDAVMTNDFFNNNDGFHNSADFALVKESIAHIRKIAGIIVPGHGNYFVNPAVCK